jgi:ribonuclease HII
LPYLIGTDEAGYGPNLGPLVITACTWEVPALVRRVDLYRRLVNAVVDTPCVVHCGKLPLAIADSKLLYKPHLGLALLERGALACMGLAGYRTFHWRELWLQLEPARDAQLDFLPWHAGCDLSLPVAADAADVVQLVPALGAAFDEAGVRLLRIDCRSLFPEEFNKLTRHYGNKAEALSRCTLQLVADVLARLPPAATHITCDKHGGRNRYGPHLQALFPEVLVEVARESREVSTYRWGPPEVRCQAEFLAGGESALETALASMVSKYLRELSMWAFNDFWRRHLPELRPTAGYPGDSRRFKTEIAALQQSLGIEDRLLWRER